MRASRVSALRFDDPRRSPYARTILIARCISPSRSGSICAAIARPAIGDDGDVLHEPAPGAITISRGFDGSPPRWNHAHGCERSLDRFGGAPIAPAEVVGTRDHQVLGYA